MAFKRKGPLSYEEVNEKRRMKRYNRLKLDQVEFENHTNIKRNVRRRLNWSLKKKGKF